MIFDCHVHTKFSTDSKMNIEDALNRAKGYNIGLTITDHMDLNCPPDMGFIFDTKDFFKEYSKYRTDSLLLGIELGLDINYHEKNKIIIDNNDFDLIIGSQHSLSNSNLYDQKTYQNKGKKAVYEEYFLETINSIKLHPYINALGHIDFICRYNPFEDKEMYYREFSDYFDEIIKNCLDRDIVLELNTRRLNKDDAFNNLLDIYTRYKELGGKFVTIGSDAHGPSAIYSNFDKAIYLCNKANLRPVYFKNRKPEFC